jgi:hypothetical protein
MRKVSCDLADGGKYAESFGLSTLSTDNMRKVSCDLADGGEYTESFGLSTLTGAICGNYLSNKIVMPQVLGWDGSLKLLVGIHNQSYLE